MNIKPLTGIIIIAVTIMAALLYRDIRIESGYTYDLRNRIVGARIQKDGGTPYYYKWKSEDGIRYYNIHNFLPTRISNITATPFFHVLLYPVADLPHRTISRIWLGVEYFFLIICMLIAFYHASTLRQKSAVLAFSILFLFTLAWKLHIASGQNYLLIPCFLMLSCYFLTRKHSFYFAFLAGACAAIVFGIRPNTLFFFLPFLFLIRNYGLRYLLLFVSPSLVLFSWSVLNTHQRLLWNEFRASIPEHIMDHRQPGMKLREVEPDLQIASFEGWDEKTIAAIRVKSPFAEFSEHGNVYVLAEKITGHLLSPLALTIFSVIIISVMLLYYRYHHRRNREISPLHLAVFGYTLYMISDLFSPVLRHQYYAVQWLGPVLLMAAAYHKNQKIVFILILAGIILNIINSPMLKMEHTIGEYLILAAMLLFSFYREPKNTT